MADPSSAALPTEPGRKRRHSAGDPNDASDKPTITSPAKARRRLWHGIGSFIAGDNETAKARLTELRRELWDITGELVTASCLPPSVLLIGLPQELWDKIGDCLQGNEMVGFVAASRFCRQRLLFKAFKHISIKGLDVNVREALEMLTHPGKTLPTVGDAVK